VGDYSPLLYRLTSTPRSVLPAEREKVRDRSAGRGSPISIPNATQKQPFFTTIFAKNREFREKIHFFYIFLKSVQSNWTLFLYLCRKFQRSCMENDALIKKAVKNALLDTLSAKGKELNLSPKQGAEIVADFATEYLLVSCDYTGASHEQIIEEYIKHLRENLVNWLNNKKQAK
jgi:hypothetical protein